jgi:hypothetical protein
LPEQSLDKKEIIACGAAKRHWQTPKLFEMDYSRTEEGNNKPSLDGDISFDS